MRAEEFWRAFNNRLNDANIRKEAEKKWNYSKDYTEFIIEMMENNEIEPSSPQDSQNSGRNGIPNSFIISINGSGENVKYSMSDSSEDIGPVRGDIYGSDVAVERGGEVGPVVDPAAARAELRDLRRQLNALERRMENASFAGDWESYIQDARWYEALSGRVNFLQRSLPESRMRHRETV